MKKNNEIITNDIDKFPEFENIRNAILEAREKVATTVNFAMVSAYWTIGKQLHEAMSGDGSIYGKQLIKYVSVRLWRAYRLLTMNEEYWRRKKKK